MSNNALIILFCIFVAVIMSSVLFIMVFNRGGKYSEKRKVQYISPEMVSHGNMELNDFQVNEEFERMGERLVDYFEREKPYLDPDIRIGDIAEKLYTNKTYLSRTINSKFNKNFCQLVHWYRIREALKLFAQSPDMRVTELCEKAGFRSMTTFNTAFSRFTGKTPADWCRNYKRKMYADNHNYVEEAKAVEA